MRVRFRLVEQTCARKADRDVADILSGGTGDFVATFVADLRCRAAGAAADLAGREGGFDGVGGFVFGQRLRRDWGSLGMADVTRLPIFAAFDAGWLSG